MEDRILELTKHLLRNELSGPIRDAFEKYAEECVTYFKRQDMVVHTHLPLECDKVMIPKKIVVKNSTIIYDKARTMFPRTILEKNPE